MRKTDTQTDSSHRIIFAIVAATLFVVLVKFEVVREWTIELVLVNVRLGIARIVVRGRLADFHIRIGSGWVKGLHINLSISIHLIWLLWLVRIASARLKARIGVG